jgi:poly [ADP-ribose] polymerase
MGKHIIDEYSGHRDGKIYKDYDCTLNQTNIKNNNNKFYIIQLIEKASNEYYVFIRYGRVGERGRPSDAKYSNVDSAIGFFEKQFKSKTGNSWNAAQNGNFTPKSGKYWLCEMDYDDVDGLKDDDDPDDTTADKKDSPAEIKCSLDKRVQDFLSLVSDVKTMKSTMVSLDIDTKKLPLGKLSQKQIDKGYTILNKIKLALKQKPRTQSVKDDISDLSSQYYTVIPYVCGRVAPPVIDTDEMIDKYTDTLDELSNITVAAKIVKDTNSKKAKSTVHPLDGVYNQLGTTIKPVEHDSDEWKIIKDYVHNTHAPTHSNYTVELLDIFEIQREGERNVFEKECDAIDNRTLLWHGTRLTNYCSILQKGLLLRPDVIPGTYITGKMFGYGIYGANSFSKSFNYCGANKRDSVACLFLAEFALGNTSNRVQSDYYITKDKLSQLGCHSTWGQGQTTPSGHSTLPDGVKVPNGKLTKSNIPGGSLLYDEFIVYDQNQLNLRYIVKVKGNFKW